MKTLAIIIGNNNYFKGSELTNGENDAIQIAEIFRAYNYEVKLFLNIDQKKIVDILQEYSDLLKDFDASIFYFAGHGFEVDGENFLASIDSQIPPENKYMARQNCITLNDLFDIYRQNPTKLNIVILDACRRSFGRGTALGFSPIIAPKGSLIAFSTSPNEGALDVGYENNSIYTGSLIKHLSTERIAVEDLFKSVRKTVFALSGGKQTTWEHTSLIGDFYFYKSEKLNILSLPYNPNVLKDENYYEDSEFYVKIKELKSYNWYKQNPAIDYLLTIPVTQLDKNQMFVLGRNLLQCAIGGSNSAMNFFENLNRSLLGFQSQSENHMLNGILFEMYYDSKGEFRFNNFKGNYREEIFKLRDNPAFIRSFDFINDILIQQDYPILFMPDMQTTNIEIKCSQKTINDGFVDRTVQVIDSIIFNGNDITEEISKYYIDGYNENGLKTVISKYLNAPVESIRINSNFELSYIRFVI
ncbi:caspase family protein [Chryseobacterium sp. Y16C]|uniref:caspase family protein n=1 Tax=Chryseobacterium TaxID=59732 RepID=UPI00162ACF93|nr:MULTISPECIES: caspase family protein [Chryseobacterium]UMQ41657.1 caspase family protein [Chryseobacterium sp. Y16C]